MSPTSNRDEVVSAVESYLRGLGARDLSEARLDPGVTYESPLSPMRQGADDLIEFLSGLFPVITGVTIQDHIVERSLCATRFQLHTTAGSVHVFDRFEVRDGRIISINPYYDPAPLLTATSPAGEPNS